MDITPLHGWIADKTGLPAGAVLDLGALQDHQLFMLRKTLDMAMKNSPFYQRHLKGISPCDLTSMEDIAALPFITPRDLADFGLQMVCVSQSDIARVVTLQTSGTTGNPKRIYFTGDDLELTADFFAHGMKTLVKPGQKVMVLMPGPNFGSVGERVSTALERIGCRTVVHGLVNDPGKVIEKINDLAIDCLIGLPVQVLSLVRWSKKVVPGRIKSVLLSGDYLPDAIINAIQNAWDCPVFNHYGLTETGLGGGVECRARQGCHLREADLFLEIVDDRGRPVPDGGMGEIVVTTLTRTGLPLIRYRTGDVSRMLTSGCACGSNLRRLDRVRGRSRYRLNGEVLRLDDLDEALFALAPLVDFGVSLERQEERYLMNIEFWCCPGQNCDVDLILEIGQRLKALPLLKPLMDQGVLCLNTIAPSPEAIFSNPAKRKIKIIGQELNHPSRW